MVWWPSSGRRSSCSWSCSSGRSSRRRPARSPTGSPAARKCAPCCGRCSASISSSPSWSGSPASPAGASWRTSSSSATASSSARSSSAWRRTASPMSSAASAPASAGSTATRCCSSPTALRGSWSCCRSSPSPRGISRPRRWSPQPPRASLLPVAVGRRVLTPLTSPGAGKPFHVGAAIAFAWPAAVIAVADQVLVNGGPLLVMLGGGEDVGKVAGLVFAATMLVRIPVFVFQGLATSLLPNLTRLHAASEPALFRRAVLRAAAGLAGCAVLIVVTVSLVGPEAMQVGLRLRVRGRPARARAARRRRRLLPGDVDVLAGAAGARPRPHRRGRLDRVVGDLPRRLLRRAGQSADAGRRRVRGRHRRCRPAARPRAAAPTGVSVRTPVTVGVVCGSNGLGDTLARAFDALLAGDAALDLRRRDARVEHRLRPGDRVDEGLRRAAPGRGPRCDRLRLRRARRSRPGAHGARVREARLRRRPARLDLEPRRTSSSPPPHAATAGS